MSGSNGMLQVSGEGEGGVSSLSASLPRRPKPRWLGSRLFPSADPRVEGPFPRPAGDCGDSLELLASSQALASRPIGRKSLPQRSFGGLIGTAISSDPSHQVTTARGRRARMHPLAESRVQPGAWTSVGISGRGDP